MTYFKDNVVWITGASSGIGEAIVNHLDIDSVKLVISARNESKLKELASSLKNAECLVLPLDLADSSTFENKVSIVLEKFGKIDLLINNGGISQRGAALETSSEVERKIMEINYFGNTSLAKEVVKSMIKTGGGQLAIMSSIAGKFGFYLRSTYSASKHALHGYYESLRLEEEPNNIRVTMICPGKINTPISQNALQADGDQHGKVDRNQSEGMDVDKCAKQILKGISKGKHEVFVGGKELFAVKIKRFFPRLLFKVLKKQNAT